MIGVDVVDVERLRSAVGRHPRLLDRVFTPGEVKYCFAKHRPFDHLAARFAAKEATFKALGQGWPYLSWRDVEVVSVERRPTIRLSGTAAETAAGRQATVSLSHDGGVAIAQVMLVPGSRLERMETCDH